LQEDADDKRGTTKRDQIYDRDYSAPTGEDKFNKELLPKVMQVSSIFVFGQLFLPHIPSGWQMSILLLFPFPLPPSLPNKTFVHPRYAA
jgi:hypothetical protein